MNLEQFRRAVFDSSPDDWEVLGSGPLYLYSLGQVIHYGDDGERAYEVEIDSHHSRATYRPDISIGVAWGLSDDDELHFDFANFPDPKLKRTTVDLLWNGAVVDRYFGLDVDGGRATLPFPKPEVDQLVPDGDHLLVGELVTADEVKLFRLLAALEGNRQFDTYLDRVPFRIVD